MRKFMTTLAAAGLTAVLACAALPSHADVVLTFNVTNVQRNECTGLFAPTCTLSGAASFTETMRISSTMFSATDSGGGGVLNTSALYSFPFSASGSPYTAALSSRLSGPVTDSTTYTQLLSTFDTVGSSGASVAQIFTDASSDTIDPTLGRTQQEYKRSYLLSAFFTDPALYADLFTTSIEDFFAALVGVTAENGYDELGTASVQDPLSLAFTSYAFTEYFGDIQLVSARAVTGAIPEPASLALVMAALLALPLAARRRQS